MLLVLLIGVTRYCSAVTGLGLEGLRRLHPYAWVLIEVSGRLGPARSLSLSREFQGLSMWSFQQNSWNFCLATQDSKYQCGSCNPSKAYAWNCIRIVSSIYSVWISHRPAQNQGEWKNTLPLPREVVPKKWQPLQYPPSAEWAQTWNLDKTEKQMNPSSRLPPWMEWKVGGELVPEKPRWLALARAQVLEVTFSFYASQWDAWNDQPRAYLHAVFCHSPLLSQIFSSGTDNGSPLEFFTPSEA